MTFAYTTTSKVVSGVEDDSVCACSNGNSQGPTIESKLKQNRSNLLEEPCFSPLMEVDLHLKNAWKL